MTEHEPSFDAPRILRQARGTISPRRSAPPVPQNPERSEGNRHRGASLPAWYWAAAGIVSTAFGLIIFLASILVRNGLLEEKTAVFWAGLLATIATLTTFIVGRFVDEKVKLQTRLDIQVDLAVALWAEIHSNMKQQRRAMTKELVIAKLNRVAAESERAGSDTGWTVTPPTTPGPSKSDQTFAAADADNFVFDSLSQKLEALPSAAICEVIEYYTFNGMLNQAWANVSSPNFQKLDKIQKTRTLIACYDLANETDAAAAAAKDDLCSFIEGFDRTTAERLKSKRLEPSCVFNKEADVPESLRTHLKRSEESVPSSQPPSA